MERIRWADGLRGIASFIVAFNHYFNGDIETPYRSFWDESAQESRYLFQLFPFRLLFAVYAMVPLIMAISGYTTAAAFIRLRESNNPEAALRHLRGATVRKFLRLYLALFTIAAISHIAYYFDAYNWGFPDEVLRGLKSRESSIKHIHNLCRYVVDAMNVFTFQWSDGFSGQLWTIPLEFRGTCVVSMLAVVLSGWHNTARLSVLVLILVHLLYYGHWDVFSFVGGLYVAEYSAPRQTTPKKIHYRIDKHGRKAISFANSALLLAGTYLLCVDGGDKLAVEYQILGRFQVHHWTKYVPWAEARFCWQSIGSVAVVFAISQSPPLHSLLEGRLLQHLGRISPSLYLIHELIYRLWRNPLRDFIWKIVSNYDYPGRHVAYLDMWPYLMAWIGSGVILGTITVASAQLYHSTVDRRCVWLARVVESQLCSRRTSMGKDIVKDM